MGRPVKSHSKAPAASSVPDGMMILPTTRQTVTHQATEALRERILRGMYSDDTPLRQDALAAELGVSRIPIREALRQLEAEGLVVFNPHRGAVVSSLSVDEIDELFELRAQIESDLVRRAVTRTTAEDVSRARGGVPKCGSDRVGQAQLGIPLNSVRARGSAVHNGDHPEVAPAE